MIEMFKKHQLAKQQEEIGAHHLVLIDKYGREAETQFSGLSDTSKRVIIPRGGEFKIGDFVLAKCTGASQNTLFAEPLGLMDVQTYAELYGQNRFVAAGASKVEGFGQDQRVQI